MQGLGLENIGVAFSEGGKVTVSDWHEELEQFSNVLTVMRHM